MGTAMRYQPQGLVRLNPTNPIARGLVLAWVPANDQSLKSGTVTRTTNVQGQALTTDGTSYLYTNSAPSFSLDECSVVAILTPGNTGNTSAAAVACGNSASNNPMFILGQGASGGEIDFRTRDSSAVETRTRNITPEWAIGVTAVAAGVRSKTRAYQRTYVNGAMVASATVAAAAATTFDRFAIGALVRAGAVLQWVGASNLVLIYNRALADAEVQSLAANPWQIFDAGSSSSTYQAAMASTAPVAGGTATAISATTGTLQLSGLAASVASTLTINASTGAQTLAGQSATVALPTTVAASAAGESLVGLSASIIAPAVIAALAGNMVTSGLAAAVALPVVVSASLATESLNGKAASVVLSTAIACSAALESLSGLSAAISTGSGIGCSLASMSMAGYPVQISAPITIAAQVAGIAATGLSASVTTGAGISCNAANLQAFGLTASIVLKTTVNAGLATSSMVGMAASIATLVPVGTITVPSSRTASFAGVQRVAVFNGKAPVSIAKGALDELYFVGDFTKDLADAATSAASVAPVSSGVTVLEGPTLQGALGVVKIGAMDTSAGAKNLFTFRVTCVNNEQFDRTIQFTVLDDRTWTFGKDPDDLHFFAFDMGKDSGLGKAALSSATTPAAIGVTASASAVIQGNLAIVMIGGMDTGSAPVNSCGLTMTFANTEKIVRAIYFTKEDH